MRFSSSVSEDSDIHSVEIATATDHGRATGAFANDTLAKLHPDGKSLYSLLHVSPESLVRSDVSGGVARGFQEQQEHGEHAECGDLWISPDGADIFTGCGTVFRAAPGTPDDMTYRGALALSQQQPPFISMVLDQAHDHVYTIVDQQPGTNGSVDQKGVLNTFGYQSLALESTKSIPCVAKGTTTQPAWGHFVFLAADGSKVFVLAREPFGGAMSLATFDPE